VSYLHHQPWHRQRITLSWNNIHTSGAYVAMNGQTLYRVSEDSLATGSLTKVATSSRGYGHDGIAVAKISDDPNITLSKARQICADSDIHPGF